MKLKTILLTALLSTSVSYADKVDDKTKLALDDMFGPTSTSFAGELDVKAAAVLTAVNYMCGYKEVATASLDLGYLTAEAYDLGLGTSYYLMRSMVEDEIQAFMRATEYDCPLMGEYIEMRIGEAQ